MRGMKYLFNSHGQHIANLIENQLHAPSGRNVGHLLIDQGILIDMKGRYLGEIVLENRLMYNRSSGYRATHFGNYGNYGKPGNVGSIGSIAGYADVEADWL